MQNNDNISQVKFNQLLLCIKMLHNLHEIRHENQYHNLKENVHDDVTKLQLVLPC